MKVPTHLWMAGSVLYSIIAPTPALAQIIPDDTLGAESSQVTPDVTLRGERATRIEGGAVRGSNLFQSFQQFNVNEGQRVYFANPSGVQNILTRITGGNPSNILGTLGVEGTANLFLLNPNGILFGPNARLDISGSFVGSTANAFTFADGNQFSAINPQAAPLLRVSVPLGLQVGAGPGGSTVIRGNLRAGQDLILAADRLQVQGQLEAGRDLRLQSANPIEGQTMRFSSGRDFRMGDYRGSSLQVDAGRDIRYGTVVVNAIDPTINPTNPAVLLRAGGEIIGVGDISTAIPSGELQAGFRSQEDINIRGITTQGGLIQLESLNGGITTNEMSLDTSNGAKDGGAIELRAFGDIAVGDLNSSSFSISEEGRDTEETGDGGAITLTTSGDIRTGNLDSSSFSESISDTRNSGNAGNTENGGTIVLRAIGNIYTGNLYSNSESSSFSSIGNSGSTGKTGNGGAIILTANGDIRTGNLNSSSSSDSGTGDTDNVGNGGAITLTANGNVRAGNLNSSSSSDSVAGDTGNVGNGGAITLTANGNIRAGSLNSSSFLFSNLSRAETGGEITLVAINTIQFRSINSTGYLRGGDITVAAGAPLYLNNSVVTSDTFGSGRGGNIEIAAPVIALLNGAQASASTHAGGQAGTIILKAGSIILDGNSPRNRPPGGLFQNRNTGLARIPPGTFLGGYIPSGNARNLNQQPRNTTYPSGIFTQTTRESTGNAGNIRIETEQLTIGNGAAIAVSTFGSGSGGDITIQANSILMDRGTLTASTLAGGGGNLTIQNLDRLLMRHESLISAQARGSADGGNITIDAPDAVIAAIPIENNDIVASAQRGNGGRVGMTIASITGLQSTAARTPLSDITASSDLGLDGVVEITPLTSDPSQGSLELPADVLNASTQISRECVSQLSESSQFVISGRGGLPPSPDQPRGDSASIVPWATLDLETERLGTGRERSIQRLEPASLPEQFFVEANGFGRDANGRLILAARSQPPPSPPFQTSPAACTKS